MPACYCPPLPRPPPSSDVLAQFQPHYQLLFAQARPSSFPPGHRLTTRIYLHHHLLSRPPRPSSSSLPELQLSPGITVCPSLLSSSDALVASIRQLAARGRVSSPSWRHLPDASRDRLLLLFISSSVFLPGGEKH